MNVGDTIHWAAIILVLVAALGLSFAALKHRKGEGNFLCDDCRFNDPLKCLKAVRPFAIDCTSYRPINGLAQTGSEQRVERSGEQYTERSGEQSDERSSEKYVERSGELSRELQKEASKDSSGSPEP